MPDAMARIVDECSIAWKQIGQNVIRSFVLRIRVYKMRKNILRCKIDKKEDSSFMQKYKLINEENRRRGGSPAMKSMKKF